MLDISSILRRCAEIFDEDDEMIRTDEAVRAVFEAYPLNGELNSILIKAATLNSLYHTYVADIYSMAQHILRQNIDPILDQGDLVAVDRLRLGHGILGRGTERNLYSFSTKYCHWYRPAQYPVYDELAKEAIQWIDDHHSLGLDVSDKSLHVIATYKTVVERCMTLADPRWTGFKRVDQALWTLGIFLNKEASDPLLEKLMPETVRR